MESEGIAIRLKKLINFLDLSDSQFADKCGISRATLSLLLSGKNKKISDVVLSQIHEAFPHINILWLLFKEGNISLNINKNNPPLEFNNESDLFNADIASSLFDQSPEESFSDNEDNENRISPTSHNIIDKNQNLIGLNIIEKQIQDAVSKGFEKYFKNYISHHDSEELTEKAKKIRQITVYYDDSTFETFSPGR